MIIVNQQEQHSFFTNVIFSHPSFAVMLNKYPKIGKLIFANDQLIPCFIEMPFLVSATANCRISLII